MSRYRRLLLLMFGMVSWATLDFITGRTSSSEDLLIASLALAWAAEEMIK
jgi:hypothetical protein